MVRVALSGKQNNPSVFDMTLADQERQTDLGEYENRKKHDTNFTWAWLYAHDQYAFRAALVHREQRTVFDWPRREKNAQSEFGVALAYENVYTRNYIHKYTLAAPVRGKAQANGQCAS